MRGYGYEPHVVAGDDPAHGAPGDGRRAGRAASTRIADIQAAARARPAAAGRRPLADDRAAHAEGLDRPADGRRPAGGGHVPLPPGAAARGPRRTTTTARVLEAWMRSYRPEELFDDDGRPVAELLALVPDGDRRMSANPVANGGRAAGDLRLPDWREHGVDGRPARRDGEHEATRVLGGWLREVTRPNPRQLPGVRARRAGQQPAPGRPRGDRRATGSSRSSRDDDGLDPYGPGHRGAVRARLPGPARGLHCSPAATACSPATRRSSTSSTRCSTSTRSGSRRASQVPWRRPIAEPQLPAVVARLAPGPQRLHPPGPGLPRRGDEQEAGDRAGVPAARRQHAAVAPTTTASAPASTSTWSWPASSRRPTGCRVEEAELHCARGVGIWEWAGTERRHRRPARRRAGLRRRRPDAGDAGRRVDPARAAPGPRGAGRQRRRPHAAAARDRAPARPARPGVRHPLHRGPAGHLRLPRLPVAGPPAHLPAPQPRPAPRARATRRRAPPPRRSTW